MSYRLGIVGSRHYQDYDEFCTVVAQVISNYSESPIKVVSGGHKDKYGNVKPGADTLAWRWAQDNNIPITEYEAEWDKYARLGRFRAAGPARNQLIVDDSDVLIAFVAPTSKGTKNSISLAQKKGIKIWTYNVN